MTYENLKEFTRVRVAVIENNTEQTLFDGVVRKTAGTGKGIRVILNDYLYVLKKKKLYSNKTYTGVAISTILAEILGEINARYASGITLSTSVTAIVDAKYKDFTSYFDIVQDLAKGGYEFSVSGKVLTFATRIGTDHSVDPDLVEFRSDVAIPQEINIVDYEISRDSENFANAVTSLPTDTVPVTVTDASSIAEYGRIEEAYTTDGN